VRVLTLCTHTEVHSFHYVDKGFVLLVLDIRATPARGTSGLYSNLRRFFLQSPLASVCHSPRVGLTAAVAEDTMLSVMIKVLSASISLFCGYPKSIISIGGQINAHSVSNTVGRVARDAPSMSS